MGTQQAVKILKTLAAGTPRTRVAEQSKAALERLTKRGRA